MRTRRALLPLLLACLPASLAAQGPPVPPTVQDCQYTRLMGAAPGELEPEWRAIYPGDRVAALQPLVAAGRWTELLDTVRLSFESYAAGNAGAGDSALLRRFRVRLDDARSRVGRLVGVPTASALAERVEDVRNAGPAIFRPVLSGGRASLFRGTPEEIVLDDSTPTGLRRTLCYHAALESALLDRFTQPGRQAAVAVLSAKRAAWESYFADGYSQLPWELYLNSRAARDGSDLDPPRTQWVLLHPSVALEIAGGGYRDLESHDAVSIELLGFLRYRDPSRFDRYAGASAVVVFTHDLGTGVGPFLHLGQAAKVGYVFPLRRHPEGGGARPGGVLVSVDLYRFLVDRKARVDDVMERIGEQLQRP